MCAVAETVLALGLEVGCEGQGSEEGGAKDAAEVFTGVGEEGDVSAKLIHDQSDA